MSGKGSLGRDLVLGGLAYLVPTFTVAIAWHLHVFAPRYDALQIYRDELLVPLGFASMLIQAIVYTLVLRILPLRGGVLRQGWVFALWAALFSWSYTTLPVAAKFPMTSIAEFVMLETGFTLFHWLLAGPAMVWALGRAGSIETEAA